MKMILQTRDGTVERVWIESKSGKEEVVNFFQVAEIYAKSIDKDVILEENGKDVRLCKGIVCRYIDFGLNYCNFNELIGHSAEHVEKILKEVKENVLKAIKQLNDVKIIELEL